MIVGRLADIVMAPVNDTIVELAERLMTLLKQLGEALCCGNCFQNASKRNQTLRR